MTGRTAGALLALAVGLASEPPVRVLLVVERVQSALARAEKDGQTAKAVSGFKLAERLDDRVVEELESLGAGPKTVGELRRLRDASAELPVPVEAPEFAHAAAPSDEERSVLIRDAREQALNYVRSLPDFVCSQVVQRFENVRGYWARKDTLEIKLTFFERKENYQLRTVNGRSSLRRYRDVGGAITEGEFGTLLAHIFSPEHFAAIEWDHWTTLRKRAAHVLRFRLAVEHSEAHLQVYRPAGGTYDATAGQHGFVYVDSETHAVLRIVAESDSLPPRFPIRSAITSLDYDYAEVGGHSFLLPLRAEILMTTSDLSTRNEVEFRDYRKYAAESSVSFEDAK